MLPVARYSGLIEGLGQSGAGLRNPLVKPGAVSIAIRRLDAARIFAVFLLVAASLQAVSGLAFVPAHPWQDTSYPIRLASVIAYVSMGVFVGANAKDHRFLFLGAAMAAVGSGFSIAGMGSIANSPWALLAMPLDAFVPVLVWNFFLRWPGNPVLSLAERAWLVILFLISSWLLICNMLVLAHATTPDFMLSFDQGVGHTSRLHLYDATVYGITLMALPVLLWRLRNASLEERRRARFFVMVTGVSMSASCGFIVLGAMLEVLDTTLLDGGVFNHLALSVDLLNLLVPLVVAYALIVDEMVPVRIALRESLRFLLGRYVIIGVGLAPFVILAGNLYAARDQTLASLADSSTVVWMLLLALPAGLSISANRRISRRLERQFFRQGYDLDDAISRVMNIAVDSNDLEQLGIGYRRLLDDLVNPSRCDFYQLDMLSGAFRCSEGDEVISASDNIAQELGLVSRCLVRGEFQFETAASKWMAKTGVEVLVPLHLEDGRLVAFLAIGRRKSLQDFGREDRRLFDAVLGSSRLVMGASRMRAAYEPGATVRLAGDAQGAFRFCEVCAGILPSTQMYHCDQQTVEGGLPRLVNGRFRIERLLGQGESGVVFAATDQELFRRVAVKTLANADSRKLRYFRRESIIAAGFAHPHLASIYDAQVCDGVPVLIYELLEKGTLADRLDRSPLSLAEATTLAYSIASGLAYLHRNGALHRDVKPSNIGFDTSDNAKLLDFGLINLPPQAVRPPAELVQTETMHSTLDEGGLTGTPLYWSPEILSGQVPGPAADVWALSCVLYEAVVGWHPFARDTWPQTASAILKGEYRECPNAMAGWLGPVMQGLQLQAPARPAASTLAAAFAPGR